MRLVEMKLAELSFAMIERRFRQVARLAVMMACVGGTAVAQGVSQDGYPMATLAFFNTATCPIGWATPSTLGGFTLVPFASIPPSMVNQTVNDPLPPNLLIIGHQHTLSTSIYPAAFISTQAVKDSKGDVTPWGGITIAVTGATDSADAGLPYLQLLLCVKKAFQQPQNPPVGVPPGIAATFGASSCPTEGWKPVAATNGRFLVGLPAGGTPGTAFGGAPLSVGENRTHTHGFSSSFAIPTVKTGGKCCDATYVVGNTYPAQGTTDPTAVGFPYAIVSQCEPCAAGDPDPACQF